MSGAAQDEELELLRRTSATLLDRAGGLSRPRDGSQSLMPELGAAGLLGVMASEQVGGFGLGLRAAGAIAQEMGRALAPEPFAATVALAIGMLDRCAPDFPLLAQVIAGQQALAVGWQSRDAVHWTDGRLIGSVGWVVGADALALVVADDTLLLVDLDADGVTRSDRAQADGTSLTDLSFTDVRAEVLAEGSHVRRALAQAKADAVALTAAELTGLSGQALRITLDHLRTRKQFGQPIGAFQALQHRAVDMHIAQEMAEAGVVAALAAMDAPDVDRPALASRAKARAIRTARLITREAIQMHGAAGYAAEYDIGRFLARSLTLTAWLGDERQHLRQWLDQSHPRQEVAA